MFSSLWQMLRSTLRFLVLDVGRIRRIRLADFSSRSLELHLNAFKGPHP